jgi:hypothetical protein
MGYKVPATKGTISAIGGTPKMSIKLSIPHSLGYLADLLVY